MGNGEFNQRELLHPGYLWGMLVVYAQGAGSQTLGGKGGEAGPSTLTAHLTTLLGTTQLLERSVACTGHRKQIRERLQKIPRRF